MAALTAFLTSTADTLAGTNGAQLTNSAPAAEASNAGAKNAKSAAGNWWFIWPKNQNITSSGTTEPAPDGNGWIWDVTTLEGQQISSGTWTPTIKMSGTACAVDVHMRAYKRSSGGVFTQIVDLTAASVALTTTAAVINPTAGSGAVTTFAVGDKLYVDLVVKIVTAGTTTTGTISVFDNGGANEQFVTPGFVPIPTAPLFPMLQTRQAVNRATSF